MRGSRGRGSLLIGLFAVLIAAAVIAGCGGSSGTTTTTTTEETKETAEAPETEPAEAAEEEGIAAAPEFTSEELNEEPTENWVTNGGNLTNDRLSTLNEINTSNVKELKSDGRPKNGHNETPGKSSGPPTRTCLPIRAAKSSAAVGTTAGSRSATGWSTTRSLTATRSR